MPGALVLFDIDGTLIRRAGPHHRQALVEAVRRVARLESSTDHIPVQGMLDRDILTIMMRNAGASPRQIRGWMPDVTKAAQSIYVRSCPNLTRRVCPGARMLLWNLYRRGIPAGLVTGNLGRIGWRKMESAGLRRYLQFGAFAEQARDRAGLVRLAMVEARRNGWIANGTRVSLIGDHPNDVLAARANGIASVAVATGLSSAEELRSHCPDVLVGDLRSLKLETLLG
jgi:phosphoglycolate phosphatase-like HAD superfamily hydrolase